MFSVCDHNLAIQAGRWNRRERGRLPVEERLSCGAVQTELHVVKCTMTVIVHQRYDFTSWVQVVAHDSNFPVGHTVHEIMTMYV